MDTEQVSIFLALLAFLALAVGVSALAIVAVGKVEKLRPVADVLLPLAFMIALTATLGSLYYSGIANFRPCRLCWWQRIMMYPMVPVLGIAALRRETIGAFYALPLALGGLGYSIYHTQLRWWPGDSTTCDIDAPCSAIWVDTFGFVSIPFMALCGFIAITGLLIARLLLNRDPSVVEARPSLWKSIVGEA
jgi:disulfide bond formation protein DsbB